jgi:mono/diheme cytochrome c family protein
MIRFVLSSSGGDGEGGTFNGPAPVVFASVRKGPNDMPAYTAKVLPDKDLNDIIAYLRSLPGPANPNNYPLLSK